MSVLSNLLVQHSFDRPEDTLYNFVSQRGKSSELSYQALARRVASVSQQLKLRCKVGDRVILCFEAGPDFIASFLACLHAGVVAVPLNPPRANRLLCRLAAVIEDAQPSLMLTESAVYRRMIAMEGDVKLKTPCVLVDELPIDNIWTLDEVAPHPDSTAFIQYTSGSTGSPKGVQISHANLDHNLSLIRDGFHHTRDSRGLIWLPHYHDMGLIGGILQPLFVGFPVTLMSPLFFLQRPIRWLEMISNIGATTSGGPNFAYQLCLEKISPEQIEGLDLSSWEVAFIGAEPIQANVLERFSEKFAGAGFNPQSFYPCYGLAESTLMVTGANKSRGMVTLSVCKTHLKANRIVEDKNSSHCLMSSGVVAPSVQVKIIDVETDKECREGEIGEVVISSASNTDGYWNKHGEHPHNKTLYWYDDDDQNNEPAWIKTGDLGGVVSGQLYITGRIKELMIFSGQNHYPHDIEISLQSAHTAIARGAAFAVPKTGGEVLTVVVELASLWLRTNNIDDHSAMIKKAIKGAVARDHDLSIHNIILCRAGAIPLTSSGKIQRLSCRELYLAGNIESLEPSLQDEK